MPLKLSRTVWVYCSCVGADCPCRVSSQNGDGAGTGVAFGPSAPPFRKAVLAVPPPGVGRSMGVTCSVVVEVMCWPLIAAVRTLLGLLTMAWVMPVSPAPEVRKFVWLVRVCSGESIVWVGGAPMSDGFIPLITMFW